MQRPLHQGVKLQRRAVMQQSARHQPSALLHIRDCRLNIKFLIDTGADVSILPATATQRDLPPILHLHAANDTKISVYSRRTMQINLGLRRSFEWTFYIGDVSQAIIGADMLSHYNLLVDVKGRRLVDPLTSISSSAQPAPGASTQLAVIHKDHQFATLLKSFPTLTQPYSAELPIKHHVSHHIETSGPPIHAKARRLAPTRYCQAKAEFESLMRQGIVRPSSSNWSSALHIVEKKNGDIRPCGDYRALNSRTKEDRYPVPHIQEFSSQLVGSSIFSRIDLIKAFHQIPVHPDDIPKTALITPFGLFEYVRMPFGLRNSAQTFQRFIDEVLRGLPFCFAYIDDLLIASPDDASHRQHLHQVFTRLQDYGVQINVDKSEFGATSLTFLGHTVSPAGIAPLSTKCEAIQQFPKPSTQRQLKCFLGMVNYYHRFIPRCSALLQPLHAMVKPCKRGQSISLTWTDDTNAAFLAAKEALADAATLSFPAPDAEVSLATDASDTGTGAVLQQFVDGAWKPIAFCSQKFNKAESNYSTYDRELLAIFKAIKRFQYYLEGRRFHVYTDHKPLTTAFLRNKISCSPRQLRHLDFVSQYTTDIRYIKGADNVPADALSRSVAALSTSSLEYTAVAADQSGDAELERLLRNTALTMKKVTLPGTKVTLYADVSTDTVRPYLPQRYRYNAFRQLHDLSHPGIRVSQRLVASRFIWEGINKDVRLWARTCTQCQASKVNRHTHSPPGTFPPSTGRFDHIHLDLVGPLPPSAGHRYLLTCVDRFTRWAEATPLADITTDTVAQAFITTWVSRFGVPLSLTSDRGGQFESNVWNKVMTILGIRRHRTSSYHPQSNGMVERFHRQLKSSLMASAQREQWSLALPLVLLGIRSSLKKDLRHSSAELVYGANLRLPGEIMAPTPAPPPGSAHDFASRLKSTMSTLQPVPPRSSQRKTFVSQDLADCTHVFIRVDAVHPPLTQPYQGPYRVLRRTRKTVTVDRNGNLDSVAIDRVKPAYLLDRDPTTVIAAAAVPESRPSPTRRIRFSLPSQLGEGIVGTLEESPL